MTVGVLYPPTLHAERSDYDDAIRNLARLCPWVDVVAEPYEESARLRTRRSAPGYVRTGDDVTPLSDAQVGVLANAHVLLALDLPFDTPALAPNLAWVQAVGSGIGQLASAGLEAGGVVLTNAAGAPSAEIAEFVIARILEHWKRLPEIASAQSNATWKPLYGRPLGECTLGLVGYGSVNRAVGTLASRLGMHVVACRRHSPDGETSVDAVYGHDSLDEMLSRSDAVVVALPETVETIHLFDADRFAAMKPGAFFCNVGRGSTVVERDVIAALESGGLAGAALDVFGNEPLESDDPLWNAPRIRLSAHCSSVPAANIARVHELFRANLCRWLEDLPLENRVDFARGY